MNSSPSQHLHRTILAIALPTTSCTAPALAQTDTPSAPSATNPCKPTADLSSRPERSVVEGSAASPTKPCPAKHHTDTSISLGAFPN